MAATRGTSTRGDVLFRRTKHPSSFVEFETAADLRTAVEKLDGREFKNARVTCIASVRLPSVSPYLSAKY
jgi:hypothetical protein